ncbi:MAG: beta-hydroxyacyl-ACP dehydratase [Planctomyces sp.]|nr:beta-hydroxyacyl-ACP dehydratase [Planctomyces sp.]MBA4120704.1 beta-hydroxyacyl-ACP dehydratase [Isosphaera sp.]
MRWMWIDRVVELVPRVRLVAIKNVSLAEEHLHDHFPAHPGPPPRPAVPVMPASLIIEGLAQSGGVLVGHAYDFRHKVILAKINRVELSREATPGSTLRYTAHAERLDEQGGAVRLGVELLDHAGPDPAFETIGSAELMFSHLDQNMGAAGQAGVDFPAHNFVFGEQFKTLLRSSGIAVPGE